MENLTGREFGPYRIVSPLGEGGMASVYKAYQPNVDRYIALKVLPRHFANNSEFISRFEQEAKLLAQLQHPRILPIYDYGEADGYTYIAMPFIEGGPLIHLIKGEPLPLDQIERIVAQVGDALDYAASRGVVHRDVKPSNILLDERGNAMLMDFGIAKIIEKSAQITATGGIVGTPAYMSPEQGRGETLDHQSDIYALGVILYEMSTGRVPFKAETPIAVLIKHINDPLPLPRKLNPNLPVSVEQVILKAMAKHSQDRFETAGQMVKALSEAIDEANKKGPQDKTSISVPIFEVPDPEEPREAEVNTVLPDTPLSFPWLAVSGAVIAIVTLLLCGVVLLNFEQISLLIAGESTPTVTSVLEPAQVTATARADEDKNMATEVIETVAEPTDDIAPTSTQVEEALASESSPTLESSTNTPEPTNTPEATITPEPTVTPLPISGFGQPLLTFGSEGIGPGQFLDARAITVDEQNGNILVGEYTGGRIQVFDSQGAFLTQWTVDTEMPLLGMDADRNGNVYVIQSGLINQYDAQTGEFKQEISFDGGWGFGDIAIAPDGGYVAPWFKGQDDIVRFSANGEPTLVINEAISGQTNSPELDTQVAIDGLGNIYALGIFNGAVFKFGPDGRFLDQFGAAPQTGLDPPPGTLESPREIEVDGQGRIYVSELVGPIKVYDPSGQLIDTIMVQGLGMTINDAGELLVASRTKVVKYQITDDTEE